MPCDRYEDMALALDAIARARARGNEHDADVKALFATRSRQARWGTYSIDGNGDTWLTTYGLHRIRDGNLE